MANNLIPLNCSVLFTCSIMVVFQVKKKEKQTPKKKKKWRGLLTCIYMKHSKCFIAHNETLKNGAVLVSFVCSHFSFNHQYLESKKGYSHLCVPSNLHITIHV